MENQLLPEEVAFRAAIPAIEEKIGYHFQDISLLQQAFTRSSFCNEGNRKDTYSSNETLEFFGDTVLSCVIVSRLIRDSVTRYEHGVKLPYTEGQLSVIKSKLSDKTNLSRSMRELGLQVYLLMNAGDREQEVAKGRSVMEDLFESIIGAVYIDSGMQMETVIAVAERMLNISVYTQADAPLAASGKNALQEFCQDKTRRLPRPVYEVTDTEGPRHAPVFHVACRIGGVLYGTGEGSNVLLAEEDAAGKVLAVLREKEKNGNLPRSKACAPADAIVRLQTYARENGLPDPIFHDLGEDAASTPRQPLYRFACLCGKLQKQATAPGKQDAKRLAAYRLLQSLKHGK